MHKLRKSVKRKKVNAVTQEWDEAVREAKIQLARMQQRIAGLKLVISNFVALRDSGHPFSRTPSTRN